MVTRLLKLVWVGLLGAGLSFGQGAGAIKTQEIASSTGKVTVYGLADHAGQVYNLKAYGATGNGSTDDTTNVQAALTAAGVNGGTVEVPQGSFLVTATLTVPSNVTIHCEAGGVITAATTVNPLLHLNGVSNVKIQGCIINGGDVGIQIDGASSHIDIQGNEIRNFGVATSDPLDPGIYLNAIGSSIDDVRILDNRIHDGVMGIFAQSNASSYIISHLVIRGNEIYANAKDGVSFYGTSNSAGVIPGAVVQNNIVYCNGWPANGTGFPATCTAGRLQSGSAASVGVGYNFNNAAFPNLVVTGNISHDQVTDGGFDFTPRTISSVNTNGTGVTWVSGQTFDTKWPVNQGVTINSVEYRIASVASSTSLTLATSAGTQTGVTLNGPRELDAVVTGNTSYRDEIGFFYQYVIGVASSGNIASNEIGDGFQTESSAELTFNGDISNSNMTGGASCGGNAFCLSNGLNTSLLGVQGRSDNASSNQTNLAFANADINPFIVTQSEQSGVSDNTATTPFTLVNGTLSAYSKLCFAGTGTGCITGTAATGINTISLLGAAASSTATVNRSAPIVINGTTYYILLSTTP